MSDFEVRGAEDFLRLSKALKAAGRVELRKELHRGMREAAKPLVGEAKKAARETFPKRGRLADREARIQFRAQVRTGRDPGVRVVAPGRFLAGKAVNATGRFRHPVFAAKGATRKQWRWVNQRVPGGQGWFDRRMQQQAPAVRTRLEAAMERVVDDVVRGAQ